MTVSDIFDLKRCLCHHENDIISSVNVHENILKISVKDVIVQ